MSKSKIKLQWLKILYKQTSYSHWLPTVFWECVGYGLFRDSSIAFASTWLYAPTSVTHAQKPTRTLSPPYNNKKSWTPLNRVSQTFYYYKLANGLLTLDSCNNSVKQLPFIAYLKKRHKFVIRVYIVIVTYSFWRSYWVG